MQVTKQEGKIFNMALKLREVQNRVTCGPTKKDLYPTKISKNKHFPTAEKNSSMWIYFEKEEGNSERFKLVILLKVAILVKIKYDQII